MQRKSLDLVVLSCGFIFIFSMILFSTLSVVYASFFSPQWLKSIPGYENIDIGVIRIGSILVSVFSFLVILGFVGVLKLKEWGRKLTTILSGLICCYVFLNILLVQKIPDIRSVLTILIFVILILYFKQPRVRSQFESAASLKISRKSVLVIDDDEGFLKTMQKILLNDGFSVLTANSGEKGLEIARMQRPDLIVLDVILPGIKGREVCVKLKNSVETRHIPVIFVTAKDSPDDREAELAAGALTHLTKPVDPKELLPVIRKVFT